MRRRQVARSIAYIRRAAGQAMVVHALAGAPLVWYERSGCASIDGRLYFAQDGLFDNRRLLQRAAREGARVVDLARATAPSFPGPDYMLFFGVAGDDGGGALIQERVGRRSLRHVDELRPALLRLQRWLRARLAARRARAVAVLMALHPRLGARSPMAVVCADALRGIVACL